MCSGPTLTMVPGLLFLWSSGSVCGGEEGGVLLLEEGLLEEGRIGKLFSSSAIPFIKKRVCFVLHLGQKFNHFLLGLI